jgi:hypothetical protein
MKLLCTYCEALAQTDIILWFSFLNPSDCQYVTIKKLLKFIQDGIIARADGFPPLPPINSVLAIAMIFPNPSREISG